MTRGVSFAVVAFVLAAIALLLLFQLSPEARLRRRRRKSHTRLTSKARRPMVRFSVRPPKDS